MNGMLRPNRNRWPLGGGIRIGIALLALWAVAAAQFPFNQPSVPEYTPGERLRMRLPTESSTDFAILRAMEAAQLKDYESAIDTLQGLLETSDDHFRFQDGVIAGSALRHVETLLYTLPPEARGLYERRYGAQADQELKAAQLDGDIAASLEVARRYPLTTAAQTSLRRAAETAFDQGQPALAARLSSRLLPSLSPGPERTEVLLEIARNWTLAGQPDATAEMLIELHAAAQQAPLTFEGKVLAPPAAPDRNWLEKVFGKAYRRTGRRMDDWVMTGGHAGRWSDGPFAHPVQSGHWAYPLIDRYDFYREDRQASVLKDLSALTARYLKNAMSDSSAVTPIQIGSPVAIGKQVFVAGYGSVKALNVETGALQWSGVSVDETFRYLTEQEYQPEDEAHKQYMKLMLGQRAWVNRTASSLATDGTRVFAVNDTGIVGVYNRATFGMMGRNQVSSRHELLPPTENRLSAYDAQSGVLQWVAGGPMAVSSIEEGEPTAPVAGPGNPILPGAFFLGAPLIVDGQVIVLAEDHGQVRVFSLDPESGQPIWSLPLVNPNSGIGFDEVRRFYGLTPSYVDGLLICPTGEGILVAVDPVLHRVEWVREYSSRVAVAYNPRFGGMPRTRNNPAQEFRLDSQIKDRQWIDTNPVQAGSRLLYPAADTGMLYCLNPLTGDSLWQVERGDGLFIAGCTDRTVVIVGERSMRAIRLDDPRKIVWSLDIPCPAGRGMLCGGNYLLPVNTNEILAVNLQAGRLLARTPVDEQLAGGSLIAAGDRLYLQTVTHLVGLRSLSEVEREIAATLEGPQRGPALAQQGELLLCRGQTDEGIAAIREALSIQDFPDARRLLVWTLLDRLKADFATHRELLPELKRLATDSDQRQLLSRLSAQGREQVGEFVEAFQEYLGFIPGVRPDASIAIEDRVIGREDRWLRGRLTHLYLSATPEQQQAMHTLMEEQIAKLKDAGDQRLFASVLGMELTPQLHLSLAINNQFESWVTARVLWTLTESPDQALRTRAAARLVELEVPLKRGRHVMSLIRALQGELADVEWEPGSTGRSFLEKLPEPTRKEIARLQQAEAVRPTVEDKAEGGTPPVKTMLPVLGAKRGPFADWNFGFESPASSVVAGYDATGKGRVSANFGQLGDPNQRAIRYVQTDANLVLMGQRDHFKILSPLDEATQDRFSANLFSDDKIGGRRASPQAVKPGIRHPVWTVAGEGMGNVGPLNFDTLVYLQGTTLTAVNPLSSGANPRIHWRRTEVTAGSEICADEDYVVLLSPLGGPWTVLQAADGATVVERKPPPGLVDRRMADWGRYSLVRRADAKPNATTWAMYDPVTDRNLWSFQTAVDTRWAPVNGSDVGFLAADGTFTLIDWQTGKTRWTTSIPLESRTVDSFSVTIDSQRLYLHTYAAPTASQLQVRDTNYGQAIPVNGLVAALTRVEGQLLWSQPMEQQLFRASLPVGSGVLTYCATRSPPGENSSRTQLTLLDALTGETLVEKGIIALGTGEGWVPVNQGLLLHVCGYDIRISRPTGEPEPKPLDEQREPEIPLKAQ